MAYNILNISRRQVVGAIGLGGAALMAPSLVRAKEVLRPEAFGAVGDGVSADGPAFGRLVEHINALRGTDPVFVECRGQYLLANAPSRPMAPAWWGNNPGDVRGIPPVLRANVTIDAIGASFLAPTDFLFRRIVRGGSLEDSFFVGWQFLGSNARMIGGIIDGQLQHRPAIRGSKPYGFGGAEFGLSMEAPGWQLEGVTSRNWGTDCLFIAASGQSINGVYERARRNGISVVPNAPIPEESPVIIQGGAVNGCGDWPDDLYNRPAAGIDVEAGRKPHRSTAIINNVSFVANRLKDVQISKAAYRCVVTNCILTNDLKIRPYQEGGHKISGNRFIGAAKIHVTNTLPGNEDILIENNDCDCSPSKFIAKGRSKLKKATAQQGLIVRNNNHR